MKNWGLPPGEKSVSGILRDHNMEEKTTAAPSNKYGIQEYLSLGIQQRAWPERLLYNNRLFNKTYQNYE